MSEEIEVPTEHLLEAMQEKLHEEGGSWIMYVAMTAAILSVLAACAALFAGHHANEATLSQIKASNAWNYYQAKGVKSYILSMKVSMLKALDKPVDAKDVDKINTLIKEQDEIKKEATNLEEESTLHLSRHVPLSAAVTFFQVAIALCALTVLTKRRWLYYGSLVLTSVGLIFLVKGLI